MYDNEEVMKEKANLKITYKTAFSIVWLVLLIFLFCHYVLPPVMDFYAEFKAEQAKHDY